MSPRSPEVGPQWSTRHFVVEEGTAEYRFRGVSIRKNMKFFNAYQFLETYIKISMCEHFTGSLYLHKLLYIRTLSLGSLSLLFKPFCFTKNVCGMLLSHNCC